MYKLSIAFAKQESLKLIIYNRFSHREGSRPDVFCEKGVLRNFIVDFIKKETLAQMFSCEFCEIYVYYDKLQAL